MPVTTIHASFWSIRQKETSFRITRTGLTTGRIISDCGKPYIWYPARTCDCMSIYCILIHGKDLRKYGALKCLPFYMASSFKEKKTIYLMIHPNGNREYFASLKCCVPRGIPMIVMQRMAPKTRWVSATSHHPRIIQSTLNPVVRHPDVGFIFTSLPNGQIARTPRLIICKPKGMPMMVTHIRRPPMKYIIAVRNPPRRNQIMLPRKFISLLNQW